MMYTRCKEARHGQNEGGSAEAEHVRDSMSEKYLPLGESHTPATLAKPSMR